MDLLKLTKKIKDIGKTTFKNKYGFCSVTVSAANYDEKENTKTEIEYNCAIFIKKNISFDNISAKGVSTEDLLNNLEAKLNSLTAKQKSIKV